MRAERSTPLAQLSGGPYAVSLGPGPRPEQVIPRLGVAAHPAVLWGGWFGGGAVLLHSPLRTLAPIEAADAARIFNDQPRLTGPFTGLGGGWLGCLGYSPNTTWLGFYDHLVRWRRDGTWTFECLGLNGRAEAMAKALTEWRSLLRPPPLGEGSLPGAPRPAWRVGAFSTFERPGAARQQYLGAVEQAIGRIHRGDFYQINLCTRLRAPFDGDPVELFADVAASLQPAWGALVSLESSTGARTLASFSPELFLRVAGGTVTTSPIKGTAPRTAEESDSPALRGSVKDAAENVMIVDLMRNDLSRVSKPGTVVVKDLLALEAHPGVWHLVSTVSAELNEQVTTADVLAATFPPGSVTGAPKIAAVQGIEELEARGRSAYTGAIGFVSSVAGVEFNVIIRTFEIERSTVELGVGGGITVDSVPVREWYECLQKAAPLVTAARSTLQVDLAAPGPRASPTVLAAGVFETMLTFGPTVLRLPAHLARLDRSCREVYEAGVPDDLADRVYRAVAHLSPGSGRRALRVVAEPVGPRLSFTMSLAPVAQRRTESALVRSARSDSLWRHKWADRRELAAAEASAGDRVPYFVTPAGDVAETSRGNIFCQDAEGVWLTPPLDEHLLPGVTRRDVLDVFASIGVPTRLTSFPPRTLHTSSGAFWTSSLSGAVIITDVDGSALPRCQALTESINAALGFTAADLRR